MSGDLVYLRRAGVLNILMMCFISSPSFIPPDGAEAGACEMDAISCRYQLWICVQVSVSSMSFDLIGNKETILLMFLDKCFSGYSHSLRISLYFERMQPEDRLPFANTVS